MLEWFNFVSDDLGFVCICSERGVVDIGSADTGVVVDIVSSDIGGVDDLVIP